MRIYTYSNTLDDYLRTHYNKKEFFGLDLLENLKKTTHQYSLYISLIIMSVALLCTILTSNYILKIISKVPKY